LDRGISKFFIKNQSIFTTSCVAWEAITAYLLNIKTAFSSRPSDLKRKSQTAKWPL
jgi:hypothetical protein